MRVEAGKMVCLEYLLSLVDGTVVDSTEGSGLWTYVHGETKMPPGLSRGVEGLEVGEHARLELSPEDAFGAIDPAAFQDVPRRGSPRQRCRLAIRANCQDLGARSFRLRFMPFTKSP